MKKTFCFLFVMALCFVQGAFAESSVTQENFAAWLKSTTISGYALDEESFENYDDKEFSAAYTCEKEGKMLNLAVKIVPIFNPEDEKNSDDIENFTDMSNEKGRAFFYSYKKMSLSVIVIGIPERNVSLQLSASPKLAAEEMQTMLNSFNIAALK